ncbi:gas vesicle protein K [Mycolicibacterium elephantis]|uniref:Gas vesicle protein GvpK n=1 Tax=Mycolicibacterium elephantis DSM 44368 TaxID=1335622 RepID=A0A439DYQ5_9MYCO|nr:gas vesicle protein K [Mycolicibacterium elephantis]MCV7223383.1 gas vesicle protein K [Mycolicibacterium elephantis]RWA22803.1 gas vesicle protein GvpK [Mycolicibacterium elephantis DSM 44368]
MDSTGSEAGGEVPAPRRRINSDPADVERGLVSLVLTLVELLRQLMERQAIRRVDEGTLTDEQIERIGTTLMLLGEKMTELREHFGLTPEDLNIDLGPLGPLLPTDPA